MNLEDIILSEINCHKKTNTARFHLHEVSKTVKFIESKLYACFGGCGGGVNGELRITRHKV